MRETSLKQDSRPSLQWYPADWRGDKELKLCTLQERGLWMELLMLMFYSNPRGVLEHDAREVCVLCGLGTRPSSVARVARLMESLVDKKVASRNGDGRMYSRRMYRDFNGLREKRAEAGKKGGMVRARKRGRATCDLDLGEGQAKEAKADASSSCSSSSSSSSASSVALISNIDTGAHVEEAKRGPEGVAEILRHFMVKVEATDRLDVLVARAVAVTGDNCFRRTGWLKRLAKALDQRGGFTAVETALDYLEAAADSRRTDVEEVGNPAAYFTACIGAIIGQRH